MTGEKKRGRPKEAKRNIVSRFAPGSGAPDEIARLLEDAGEHDALSKLAAFNDYVERRAAGDDHGSALASAARKNCLSGKRVEVLISQVRLEQSDMIAAHFNLLVDVKGLSVNDAFLRTLKSWGYGDGLADAQGRTFARVADLKKILIEQSCAHVDQVTIRQKRRSI